MKKRIFSLITILILIFSFSVVSYAAQREPDETYSWNVIYTRAHSLGGNFDAKEINDAVSKMEPGDMVSFNVEIINEDTRPARWYMSNSIEKTLEASGFSLTNGGAYDYTLKYSGPRGTSRVIYDSSVGGEDTFAGREGLSEATINLEEFFLLDTLNSGESGTVNLTLTLDGETQGNVYQNTLGQLKLQFGVEPTNDRKAVKTGDENNLVPYYIGMSVAGLLFLYLALDALTDKLYKKKGRS